MSFKPRLKLCSSSNLCLKSVMLNLYFYCMTVLLKVDLYLHLFALFIQLCSESGIKEYLCSVFMPLKWAGQNSAITSALKQEKLIHNQGEGSWFSLWIIIPNIYDLIPDSVCVRHHILSVCLSLFFLPLCTWESRLWRQRLMLRRSLALIQEATPWTVSAH